jgi:hypothetical protein
MELSQSPRSPRGFFLLTRATVAKSATVQIDSVVAKNATTQMKEILKSQIVISRSWGLMSPTRKQKRSLGESVGPKILSSGGYIYIIVNDFFTVK